MRVNSENMVKPKIDFTGIKCCRCGRKDLNSKNALREYKNGIFTRNWLCLYCHNIIDYIERYRVNDEKVITKVNEIWGFL